VKDLVISPRISESSARLFYEGQPLLEEASAGSARAHGGRQLHRPEQPGPRAVHEPGSTRERTLSEPRFGGDVRPTDGRFHILGLHGDFELVPNVNHVTSWRPSPSPPATRRSSTWRPQNVVPDSAGNEHVVRMRISGPIGQAAIDLSSDDGLDRNQTLVLLFSGRTPRTPARFGTTARHLGSNFRSPRTAAPASGCDPGRRRSKGRWPPVRWGR